jgi:glycogen debranching enzyme
MGEFIGAAQKLGKEEYTVEKVVKNLEYHLNEETLGNISEIFDGDYPYTPRGCFAQAWSIAEILQRMM